jgi:hypothetical protein
MGENLRASDELMGDIKGFAPNSDLFEFALYYLGEQSIEASGVVQF